jgi:hypothetical protein
MKTALLLCLFLLTTIFTSPAYAQTPSSPPSVQVQAVSSSSEFKTKDESSSVITLLKNFIQSFDSFLGGFIFYTPDPLANKILLKDNTEIPGVSKYRDIFNQIAIPALAIIIAGIAISKLGTDNTYELKTFAVRFLIVLALFLTVPPLLSYSIQFNNLLVNKISETQKFTGFLETYFDKSQQGISQGEMPEKYGIPAFGISLENGILESFGKFIVELFLFALTFIFLLCGFLYIGFQFVIRFATLLFLGVIYPIVLPFALVERTQPIVQTFFKTWFTFLIQQPAFVLGFAIAQDIFNSILNANGPSVGMLFFYTGFLFFLGGVNMLVARIFGDVWVAASNNITAGIAARSISSPISGSFSDFKKGFFGNSSLSNTLGYKARGLFRGNKAGGDGQGGNGSPTPNSSNPTDPYVDYRTKNSGYKNGFNPSVAASPFSMKLADKGFTIEPINQKQGVVAVSGQAFKYDDKRNNLTSYYPTQAEAMQDGISPNKLEPVNLKDAQFIDLSTFSKVNPNPHNFNAMQEAKKQGKSISYAYVDKGSHHQKVKNFLEVSRRRNEAYGIDGVIVERQAQKGSKSVVRMYTHKSYEKRKDI